MKKITLMLALFGLLVFAVGCSDDDGPTGGGTPEFTEGTSYDATTMTYTSRIDASGYDAPAYFDFDTATTKKASALAGWDMAFKRDAVFPATGVAVADLGVVDFDAVTIVDTLDAGWGEGELDYFIDNWYLYENNQIFDKPYVYSMKDAGGHNYLKFRVDSIRGAGQPPDMGDVYLSYFYQTTADSRDLSGTIEQGMVEIGEGVGYYDFSTGQQVSPTSPANSLNWDIAFENYNCMQNNAPTGIGASVAFPAGGEMEDSTDIEGFIEQPAAAPMFPDAISSAISSWYTYNPETHSLTSNGNVYLVRTDMGIFKMKIESYYGNMGGTSTSGLYTFVWTML